MNPDYWTEHFRRNAEHRPEPDWDAPVSLRGPALSKLVKSLQQFQLGDGGGPAYLIAWNRERLLGSDAKLKSLVDVWFAEEREHSRLLGSALKRFFAREIRDHWSFSLFCGVRRMAGVRFELYALLLTEIVSHVYYKMMRKHVNDRAVREMCALIIRDEAGHIAFHRARLTAENRRFGKVWEAFFRMRGLAAGTVLWMNHRGALRASGATDAEFYRGIWQGMDNFIRGLRGDLERMRAGAAMKPCSQMVAECA
ncbi:hypothetical protein OKA04_23685 [Luteolibacter flavescens]|uniref:Ferritin-like domain-containing protein n=1 Tax=Luteolibacter flavescens TaxID=1859460 RepID=A0ABT3FW19_9BACT|nr:hypothetical protein [Luteolibacter flavescens]MCW1887760.1 hypothetical protein [Luteolibacter flavescens]